MLPVVAGLFGAGVVALIGADVLDGRNRRAVRNDETSVQLAAARANALTEASTQVEVEKVKVGGALELKKLELEHELKLEERKLEQLKLEHAHALKLEGNKSAALTKIEVSKFDAAWRVEEAKINLAKLKVAIDEHKDERAAVLLEKALEALGKGEIDVVRLLLGVKP